MSFPKKGKSFPKKGKSFPKRGGDGSSDFSLDDHAFAMKIASALRSELRIETRARSWWRVGRVRMSARSKIGFWDDTHPAADTCSVGSAFRPGAKCHFVMADRQDLLLVEK